MFKVRFRVLSPVSLATAGLCFLGGLRARPDGASGDSAERPPVGLLEASPKAPPPGFRTAPSSPSPRSDEGPLEEVETRQGKTYRGSVAGYDAATRSYIFLIEGNRLALAEAEILTIRPIENAVPRARPEPPARAAVGDEPPVSKPAQFSPVEPKDDRRAGEVQWPAAARSLEPRAAAVRFPESGPADREADSLESVAARYRQLPAPRTPEALQSLEEAMERIRAGQPLAAIEPLRRAVQFEPGSATALLLLAAVHLDVEKDAEAAYPLVLSAAAQGSAAPLAGALLERTAGALGYRRLRDRLGAEAIERRFEGAERQYRLFRHFEKRDGERARTAWNEYRKLDPRWEIVASAEGRSLRTAAEALDRGETTAAAGHLLAAISENELVEDDARPLLMRLYTSRAEKARGAGRFEVAAADLKALAEELPARRSEFEGKLHEVEAAMVTARLGSAESLRQAEAAVAALGAPIPDLRARFGGSIAEAYLKLAKTSASRDDIESALAAAKAALAYGGVAEGALIENVALALGRAIAAGSLDGASQRLAALDLLVGERVKRGSDEADLSARLREVRAQISVAYRAQWSAQIARGERKGALKALREYLFLEPDDAEARRRLEELEPSLAGALSEPGVAVGPETLPYLPLIAGSRWGYLQGDGSREVQKLDRIEALADGRTVYRFSTELRIGEAKIPYQKTGFFAGEYFQFGAGMRATAGELILKLPVAKGERWTWKKGDIHCEREYVDTEARVVCRAGTFDRCVKVKATSRFVASGVRSRPVVQWFYYAPGVGLVKIEAETPFDGRELEDYHIGPSPIGPSPAAGEKRKGATADAADPATGRAAGWSAPGYPGELPRLSSRKLPLMPVVHKTTATFEDDRPAAPAIAPAAIAPVGEAVPGRDGEEPARSPDEGEASRSPLVPRLDAGLGGSPGGEK